MATGFPTQNTTPTKAYLYEIYGDILTAAITYTPGSPAGTISSGTTYNVGSRLIPYGFRAKIKKFYIKTNFGGKCLGYVARGAVAFAEPHPKMNSVIEWSFPTGGGIWELNWDLDVEFLEGGILDLKITSSESITNAQISVMPIGQLLTQDPNTDADGVVDVWGDSITWQIGGNQGGGATPNYGYTHWAARVCSALRADGVSVWENNKGFGGANTQNIVDAMNSGYYGRPKSEWNRLKMVMIGVGINDSASGSATSQGYQAKMKQILNYIYKHAPNCAVLLAGQTPVDPTDTNRALYVQSYRDVLQALVTDTDYTGKQLRYVEMTTNFTVTAANYTDTAPMLHPRWDTGGLIMFNNAYPVVKLFDFYVNR